MPSNLPIDGHSFRRVEVLTGTPRRRRWSAAEKAAIVAESFAPGAVTSAVALRHGLHRNQLYGWRRELRSAMVAASGVPAPDFVPVVAEPRSAGGLASGQRDYIGWLLTACAAEGVAAGDMMTESAIALLADRLRTPLQIEQHLTLAFEEGFRIGEKPVTPEAVEAVLSRQLDDLEPKLTRHG